MKRTTKQPVAFGDLARSTRVIGGSYYRAAEWSRNAETLANQCGRFCLRVSATGAVRVTLSTPTLLTERALTLPAHQQEEAIDASFDILAGRACLGDCGSVATTLGCGATIPAMQRPNEPYVVAMFALDKGAHMPSGSAAQKRLGLASAAYLGEQYAQEVTSKFLTSTTDETKETSRLEIARLIRLAVILGATLILTGDNELDQYGKDEAETDTGAIAWARFASAEEHEDAPQGLTDQQEKRRAAADRTPDNAVETQANATVFEETPAETDARKSDKAPTIATLEGRASQAIGEPQPTNRNKITGTQQAGNELFDKGQSSVRFIVGGSK